MGIYEQLEAIFQTVFGSDTIELRPETTAADVPGWDSISYINLMVSIEQEFGISFSSAELGAFESVGGLVENIECKVPNLSFGSR